MVPAAPGPGPDEHAGRAGAHEVEGRLVRGAAADDHRDLVVADEVLQVERLVLAGHVLGRHDRALDHQQVGLGPQDVRAPAPSVRWGVHGHGHGVPGGLELADALLDEVGLHRLGVDLLHPAGGLVGGEAGDLLEQRLGVGVAGPQALEVQHAEAAEAPELGRRRPGDTTLSDGDAMTGSSKRNASISQEMSTSSGSRVRRLGTMAMSSKP